MWYNASKPIDKQRAIQKLNYLLANGKTFELTEKKKTRSISQNSYLHLILSVYALEMGETLKYTKEETFKKEINNDIFMRERVNYKTGEIRNEWRSTANLDTKEMTVCIDRFCNHAAKDLGLYLPDPHDLVFIDEMKIEVENKKEWL